MGLTDRETAETLFRQRIGVSVAAMDLIRLIVAVSVIGSTAACVPPDCDRQDLGSCVNACCKLQWEVASPVWALAVKIENFLQVQGADGRYTLHQNQPSIQPWNSNTTFVLQGTHVSQKETYVDVLHIAVAPSPTGATVYAFSHSQDFIAGNFAYSDRGQNYKNLALLIKSLGLKYTEKTLFGCPIP